MKVTSRPILILIGAALLWYLSGKLFPDEEQEIRSLLDTFIQYAEVDGRDEEEHPIVSLDKGQEAAKLVSEPLNVLVRFDEREKRHTFLRDELAKQLVVLRRYVASLDLSYEDEQMSIDGDRATVMLLAQAIWRFRGESELYRERRKCKLKLEKSDSEWRIVYAENVEALEWYSEE